MKDSMSREAKDSAADRRRGPRTSMVTSQPRADFHVAASQATTPPPTTMRCCGIYGMSSLRPTAAE